MFTGLVETTGTLVAFADTAESRRLTIDAPAIAGELGLGESVAVNGCCLTVVSASGSEVQFDLLAETLARTNLGRLQPGSAVNLERALAANARLGGHFVQGHIDCTTDVVAARESGPDWLLEFALPAEFAALVVAKGSVAINGVSLTIASLTENRFAVCIIPHTREATNLGALSAGAMVNLEFDVLAKYVERLFALRA